MANSQIFVSYSSRNQEFVERLTNDLRSMGFNIWRDIDNLTAGTANWETTIRHAIKESTAIILVASPDALQSEYVQGELTLAKLHQRPVYPIWAYGDNWIDCVPLDMSNYQYVDCRKDRYEIGVNQLELTLNKIFDKSQGTIQIGLPSHQIVSINLAQYEDFDHFLNELYMQYGLFVWYEPFRYGRDWVLGNVKTRQIAVPNEWLTTSTNQALSDVYPNWDDKPIADFGITANSYWAAWSIPRLPVACIALKTQSLKNLILSDNGYRELQLLLMKKQVVESTLDEYLDSTYPYQFIVAITPDSLRYLSFRSGRSLLNRIILSYLEANE